MAQLFSLSMLPVILRMPSHILGEAPICSVWAPNYSTYNDWGATYNNLVSTYNNWFPLVIDGGLLAIIGGLFRIIVGLFTINWDLLMKAKSLFTATRGQLTIYLGAYLL